MPRSLSEELTRKDMIHPELEKAGCFLHDRSKVKMENPRIGYDRQGSTVRLTAGVVRWAEALCARMSEAEEGI